jgi:hypothetical protein
MGLALLATLPVLALDIELPIFARAEGDSQGATYPIVDPGHGEKAWTC